MKYLAVPVLSHRVIIQPTSRLKNVSPDNVISDILYETEVPGENSPKTWNEMKIHKNFWIAFFLFVSLVIFQTYVKDSSVERTIYLIALLILVNLVITISSSDKLNLKRTTKEPRQQVGQYFKENYEIENNKSQPLLWASIIDESNITSNTNKKIIAWIPGFGKRNFINQVQLSKNAVYSP